MVAETSRPRQEAVITDEGIERLRARIGVEIPEQAPYNEFASKDVIGHYARGVGDDNPLWANEEYVRRTRWGNIIAPPLFVETTGISEVKEIPPEIRERGRGALAGVHNWYSGDQFEFFLPIWAGDRLTIKSFVAEVLEKKSEFAGRTVHEIRRNVWTNQRGELVAIANRLYIWGGRQREPGERKKYVEITRPTYTEEQFRAIEADYEKEERRGANPRYWEDVNVGDELTPVVKGPLVVTDCIAFDMGRGSPYIRAHRIGYEYRKRHPAAYPMDPYGVPDVVERVHWDDDMARRTGNPGAYDYGAQRIAWLCHLMTNWIGDDGFLRKLDAQFRAFNYIGDTTWCKGKVTNKYVQDGEHLVECEIWSEDQRGRTTAPGHAIAALPSREAGPVVLKLKRP